MKTVFDPSTLNSLIDRIEKLQAGTQPYWGKMTPYQMVRHCILSENMYLGYQQYDRSFIGRLFGKMALKGILKDEAPMKQNQPTHPTFVITDAGDLEPVRQSWISLLKEYPAAGDTAFADFRHPFFGSMTPKQIGQYVYKHTDHHLRQFGV